MSHVPSRILLHIDDFSDYNPSDRYRRTLVAFAARPYYQVFRLDEALGSDEMGMLEQLVDVSAIRRNYKERMEAGLGLQRKTQVAHRRSLRAEERLLRSPEPSETWKSATR